MKLSAYETQARLSVILAVIGAVFTAATAFAVFQKFDPGVMAVVYAGDSLRFPIIMAGTALAMSASGIGFFIGLNSAGQKRNTKSGLSWVGFFINAVLLTITVCVFIFFYFVRMAVER